MRYFGLDALRAVAMLMGIVIHATLVFTEPSILADAAPGVALPPLGDHWIILTLWIHQWRMPLFFMLAGFFAAMTLERRGAWSFAKDRFLRIWVVFALFMALLSLSGFKSWGELHHLWFLLFLGQYCLLAALGFQLGFGRFLRPALWILDRPTRLFLLYLPMVPLVVFCKENLLGQVIPEQIWQIRWQGLVYYAAFFLLGMGFWQRRARLDDLARPKIWISLLVAASLVTVLVTALSYQDSETHTLQILTIPAGQLGFILGFLGMAHGLVKTGGPVLRFLVESAYGVYLLHLYVIAGFGITFIIMGFGADAVVPLSILCTIPVTLLLYVALIRYTPLDMLLAGPHKARVTWPVRAQKKTAAP